MQPDDLTRLEAALAASAEDLTRRPGGEQSWQDALARLTATAATAVPGAVYVGLTMRGRHGDLVSQAPSHDAIVELDRAQAELGEGPCVQALASGEATVVRVADFADEPRWPRFAPLAVEAGIASLVSYALAPRGAPPGAMNFYATTARAFDDDDDPTAQAMAGAFATQAAVAVYGARRIADLNIALASRDVIGQAKGILMERFALDDQQAFDLLVSSSQDTNIKLVDVARWLTTDTARRASASTEQRPSEAVLRGATRPDQRGGFDEHHG